MNKKKALKKEIKEKDKIWRDSVLFRFKHSCAVCGINRKIDNNTKIHVHHIIPRENKEFRWDINNGVVLCARHHKYSFEISAHRNSFAFYCFLYSHYPDMFNYLKIRYPIIITQNKINNK